MTKKKWLIKHTSITDPNVLGATEISPPLLGDIGRKKGWHTHLELLHCLKEGPIEFWSSGSKVIIRSLTFDFFKKLKKH